MKTVAFEILAGALIEVTETPSVFTFLLGSTSMLGKLEIGPWELIFLGVFLGVGLLVWLLYRDGFFLHFKSDSHQAKIDKALKPQKKKKPTHGKLKPNRK